MIHVGAGISQVMGFRRVGARADHRGSVEGGAVFCGAWLCLYETDFITLKKTFFDLGLSETVLETLRAQGYEEPTHIQEKVIPQVLIGRDVVGLSQTGTGKTAAFLLPMLDILSARGARARMPRALIIEPTRELGAQVYDNFQVLSRGFDLSMALLIGGVGMSDQESALARGPDIVTATPGRLLDHIERGRMILSDVHVLVLDEADRMLDMGFIPDIRRIFSWLPPRRQTLMLTATMAGELKTLAATFLSSPVEIVAGRGSSTPVKIRQSASVVGAARERHEALLTVVNRECPGTALVFCNRKRSMGAVRDGLVRGGYKAEMLHGDMDQHRRMAVLDSFRNGEIRMLICSDVAARGLDIPNVSHVFNFDLPTHAEDYVHRIGRTGRAGREGVAYSFLESDERDQLATIEALIGQGIPLCDWSTGALVEGSGVEVAVKDQRPARPARGGRGDRPARVARGPRSDRGGQRRRPERESGEEQTRERGGDRTREHGDDRTRERGGDRTRERGGDRARERGGRQGGSGKKLPHGITSVEVDESRPFGDTDQVPDFLLR